MKKVVTKTTCGLIVLPREHTLVERKSRPVEAMAKIGRSACDQCSYCTEFCPRYLLGYDVQPHKVMRTLGFTLAGEKNWSQFGQLCCACGLCTLYACKTSFREAGMKYTQAHPVQAHPMKEYRRVPQEQLRKRLQVDQYETPTPFQPKGPEPKLVRLLTKQHAGKPASPVVEEGAGVEAGQAVARMKEGELGADVHASIAGRVTRVGPDEIWIEA
jgi:Na+-translocating ferredoxin:NAD+ oxidoreductase RnfC subunit